MGAIQAGDMEEALAEIADAAQAMGWGVAEQPELTIVGGAGSTAGGGGVNGVSGSGPRCGTVWVAALGEEHAVVVEQALTIDQVVGGAAHDID